MSESERNSASEFEFTYFEAAVQHFCHNDQETHSLEYRVSEASNSTQ